jgi:hypothetical protein
MRDAPTAARIGPLLPYFCLPCRGSARRKSPNTLPLPPTANRNLSPPVRTGRYGLWKSGAKSAVSVYRAR